MCSISNHEITHLQSNSTLQNVFLKKHFSKTTTQVPYLYTKTYYSLHIHTFTHTHYTYTSR